MLKVDDVGLWNDELNLRVDRFLSRIARAGARRKRSEYEFKFSSITEGNRPIYEAFIDFYLSRSDAHFCALVIDKNVPGVNPIAACGSTWDALIAYSITLLRTNIQKFVPGERAIVVSDNYQKPRASEKYFEREIISSLREKVANVVMAESSASNFLQMVDILLGSVMYHHKLPHLRRIDAEKRAVADRLAAGFGTLSFARTQTFTAPSYFNVWQFTPRVTIEGEKTKPRQAS